MKSKIVLLILVLGVMGGCSQNYDETIHTCLDYACGYVNPFGGESPEFRISQIENTTYAGLANWTDRTRCPKVSGTYAFEDSPRYPRHLVIEECVEWIDTEVDE